MVRHSKRENYYLLQYYFKQLNLKLQVTQCGHLYCWSCLYRWLNTNHTTCPVCKAGVSQDNVIPIYLASSHTGSGQYNKKSTDENVKNESLKSADSLQSTSNELGTDSQTARPLESPIPNRPQAHRPEPIPIALNQHGNNAAQFGGIHFSAGFGFFPSLFGLQFQSFVPQPSINGTVEEEAQKLYLTRILYILGVSVVLCLLFF